MPQWKALPGEIDPQLREFAGRLRRLVDRSGLSVAAVAERTGYSRAAWERYLDGQLLPSRGAVVALAEVTGTDPAGLTAAWERTERAWRRPGPSAPGGADTGGGDAPDIGGRGGPSQAAPPQGEFGPAFAPGPDDTRQPAVPSPPVPPQREPPASTVPRPQAPRPGAAGPAVRSPGGGSAATKGPARRKAVMFVSGVVAALLVTGGAALLTDLGGEGPVRRAESPPPSPAAGTPAPLPAGVKCAGDDCTGQDPENMGCGGQFATTATSITIGASLLEVRYSKTCGAAWARITRASPGDTVEIASVVAGDAGARQGSTVDAEKDAYTPMVAVPDAAAGARACATLAATGERGCTPTR